MLDIKNNIINHHQVFLFHHVFQVFQGSPDVEKKSVSEIHRGASDPNHRFMPQLGGSMVYWSFIAIKDDPFIIELDDGKIYRKALYLMVKTMVSCRFSLKPIH